jgi:hypothetical protein
METGMDNSRQGNQKESEDKKEEDNYLRKHTRQHVPMPEQRLLP